MAPTVTMEPPSFLLLSSSSSSAVRLPRQSQRVLHQRSVEAEHAAVQPAEPMKETKQK
jgi:hypothetical protein